MFLAFIKNLFSKLARKKEDKEELPKELGCNCNNCDKEEKEKNPKTLCIHIDPLPCEPNPFFQCKEEFTKFFTEFESKITTVYRYYNMNNIFLKEYLSRSKEALQASREKRDENFSRYSSCYFINNNSFKDIHYMSTLMNIYMAFETLLKSISKDVAYDKNMSIEDVQEKNMPYLNGYMSFLEENFEKKGLFSGRENEFVNIIRKIRNDYIHDSMTEIPEGMERDIVKLFNLREGKRITVDDMLINNTFSIFGEIASKLEKAYWAYKRDYLNTVIK